MPAPRRHPPLAPALGLAAALAAPAAASGPACTDAAAPGFDALVGAYYACDAAASAGTLSPSDAGRCSQAYMALKLAFLPGVDTADLAGLAPGEQAAVNASGYALFKAWEACFPARVAEARRAAATRS